MTVASALLALALVPGLFSAQATAALQGRVFDAGGAVIAGARIDVRDTSALFVHSVVTDRNGRYAVTAVPPGTYVLTATARGFRSEMIEQLVVETGRTVVRDFHLVVGDRTEQVTVRAEWPVLDRVTTGVGHMVTAQTIHDLPLNGQHFLDLGLLVAGSVTPSQTGFSTTPIRGRGALSINSAGNREEAVAFMINGVSTNNLTFGSITLQPPVAGLQEFRVENSAFGPEFGHVSGAVVDVVTRSGTDRLQAAAFELFRDDALDARNYFDLSSEPAPIFNRHQFGGWIGGPIVRGRTHVFVTYEGLRQRQGISLNSLVLADAERGAATDDAARRLIELIPRANAFNADGTARFVGAGEASVDADSWSVNLRHVLRSRDQLKVYLAPLRLDGVEPASQGNTIPGFGLVRTTSAAVLTIGETRTIGSQIVNEFRFGRSYQNGRTEAAARLNPSDFGIHNGVDRPIGLPQIVVAGGLNFGGPSLYPQGRRDTSYVLSDAITHVLGRHYVRAGGEYRLFLNDNVAEGTGQFNFPTVAAFLSGTANAFSVTLGERQSHIRQRAVGGFVQDRIALGAQLSVELGLRYEWHVTPTERDQQFVVFDTATASLVRVGVDVPRIYRQNNRNFEPRLGVAWTPGWSARTVIRAAYARAVDEPGTTAVRDTAGNPPFARPLSAAGAVALGNALDAAQPARLAPATVDPDFTNASLQSWNVNVQWQLGHTAAMAGYFGSHGRDLRISRDLNQPVDGVGPFPAISLSSPILPGVPLGSITQVESSGFSRYHGLWVSATRRLTGPLHFDAAYTWSVSRDTNSLNSSNFAVQNSYDIPAQHGPSDFDARHRVAVSVTYLVRARQLLLRDWQLAAILQAQSGNPINIVTSTSTVNGTANTVRPDVTGPIRIIGSVDQWFDPTVFQAVDRFGNLGRNAVTGPGFRNVDFSLIRRIPVGSRGQIQLRLDVFNLFNDVNLGPPGNVVGTPMFAMISRTRLPTGEAGSSRQVQLGLQMSF